MGITNKKEISMVTSMYVVVVSTRPAKPEYWPFTFICFGFVMKLILGMN